MKVGVPVIFKVVVHDLDKDKLNYLWNLGWGEKEVTGTSVVSRVFNVPGTKEITLTINDGRDEVVQEWKVNVVGENVVVKKVELVQQPQIVQPPVRQPTQKPVQQPAQEPFTVKVYVVKE